MGAHLQDSRSSFPNPLSRPKIPRGQAFITHNFFSNNSRVPYRRRLNLVLRDRCRAFTILSFCIRNNQLQCDRRSSPRLDKGPRNCSHFRRSRQLKLRHGKWPRISLGCMHNRHGRRQLSSRA